MQLLRGLVLCGEYAGRAMRESSDTISRSGIGPFGQQPTSLVESVTEAIERSIIEMRLAPGSTVAISDLASDLGVSHSPVREALQRLSAKGLVELRVSRSAVIAPLTRDDLEEIFRVRRLIEVDAIERACPQLTDADLETLARHFDVISSVPVATAEFWTSLEIFHTSLLRPVMTKRLGRLLDDVWNSEERYVRALNTMAAAPADHPAGQLHRPLLEAARSRDSLQMRAAMLEYLRVGELELSVVVAPSGTASASA